MTKEFNIYGRQLTEEQIRSGLHREVVGGMWDEMGRLQLEFMRDMGLSPGHALLDVGCGSMRGGVCFVEYLEARNYCGMDINESLITAGWLELERADLMHKCPNLLVDADFAFQRFGTHFDFAIAQSVFSHLPSVHITQCLSRMGGVLKPGGEFFATYFEAPYPGYAEPLLHGQGGVISYKDRDPFHYSFAEFESMARAVGMTVRNIGDWGHPRDQKMLGFKVANPLR
jgi:ubiquinone/menaquinone biosynthesis C-methylase UbiE